MITTLIVLHSSVIGSSIAFRRYMGIRLTDRCFRQRPITKRKRGEQWLLLVMLYVKEGDFCVKEKITKPAYT